MRIEPGERAPTLSFSFKPERSGAFKVRGVFVVDGDGRAVWAVVPAGEYVDVTPEGSEPHLEIRGGEHYILSHGDEASLPPVLRSILEMRRDEGFPLSTVTFGEVPEQFEQIIPPSGAPDPLQKGKTYQIFVLGSEGSSLAFSR